MKLLAAHEWFGRYLNATTTVLDLVLIGATALAFWWIAWVMLRQTATWDWLGRALLGLFAALALLFTGALAWNLWPDGGWVLATRWALRLLLLAALLGFALAMRRFPWPPPPERPPFSRFVGRR
jgi:hypothetical protein